MKNLFPFTLLISFMFLCACQSGENQAAEPVAPTEKKEEAAPKKTKSLMLNDTTPARILDALYGNYDRTIKAAIVEPEEIVFQNKEMQERAFEPEEGRLIAKVVCNKVLPDSRSVIVVAIRPEEDYECRICAPTLGAMILKNKGKEWYSGDMNYYNVSGSYGFAPGFKIQAIGKGDYALVEEMADVHMGRVWSAETLYSVNRNFKELLSVHTHGDNSGACEMEEEEEPCFEHNTSIKYIPSDNDYYEIETHNKGTEWDYEARKMLKLDEKVTYSLQDGIYKKENIMSSIYSFGIESVEDCVLRVDASIVHPDVDWVDETKNFALQIILELYEDIAKGYIYNAAWQSFPFDQKQGDEFIRNHPLKEQMPYWLELMRGGEMDITEEEYKNMDKLRESGDPKFQNIGSWGMSGDRCYVSFNPNYKAFMKVAEIAIMDVEMKDVEHMPWKHNQMSWEEREKLTDEDWEKLYENQPSCTLKITVLNKEMLHHVKVGTHWESAMYDFTYYAR